MDVCEKHWLDYVQAFGTIALGVGVWWVYWQQWRTQQKQLKVSLTNSYTNFYEELQSVKELVNFTSNIPAEYLIKLVRLRGESLFLEEKTALTVKEFIDKALKMTALSALSRSEKDPERLLQLKEKEQKLYKEVLGFNLQSVFENHIKI